MKMNAKLSCAIAAVLSTPLAATHVAAQVSAASSDADSIAEITVTAQRRSENIQNVPITMQALTGDTLRSLNVESFDCCGSSLELAEVDVALTSSRLESAPKRWFRAVFHKNPGRRIF
jgi:hypothetical protein